ncbi:MAG: cold-shock protein [Candidatus Hodarchaeota archaeon]
MVEGIVKWFNGRKGYGFITCEIDSIGKDVFVHYTAIKDNENKKRMIYEGDKVAFDIIEGRKGLQASNVIVVEKGQRLNRYQNFYY